MPRCRLGIGDELRAADLGIAAFVQDIRDGDMLQALYAPLCSNP